MHESHWFRSLIETEAAARSLDPDLVEAIVRVESGGLAHAYRYERGFWARYLADDPRYRSANPKRVSASYGLMQCLFSTAVDHGYTGEPEGLFIPRVALAFGCAYLASLFQWSNDELAPAVAAYNGGKGVGLHPPFRNQRYVDTVLAALGDVQAERRGA
jgi:soluble lytic murein transglycosylase-like protein